MEMTTDNYLQLLNKIVDEEMQDKSVDEIISIKNLIKNLINDEKEYEFNDKRPRIKQLLDSLIND